MFSFPDLPAGRKVIVACFGKDQLDAIETCLQSVRQAPPTLGDLVPGDVVVAIKATEIVWTDTVMATGQYQHKPRIPYTPGMVFAGTVVFSTPEARAAGFDAGARVVASGDAGPRSHGRYQSFGGCATYAVAPATALRPVPRCWSFAEAACGIYGYDTAYHALVECGRCKRGEILLVHGASGGVGIPAVQLGVAIGLTVIATTRSEKKRSFLLSLGASHVFVLNRETGPRSSVERVKPFATEIKRLTNGRGCDVVYDGVGGADITVESMRALRFGGRLLVVGWAATPNVAAGRGVGGSIRPNLIPTNLIMMKSLRIIGCPAAIAAVADKAVLHRRVQALEALKNANTLPPPTIGNRFPLDKTKEALRSRVASGSTVGSTVVIVDGETPPVPLASAKAMQASSRL